MFKFNFVNMKYNLPFLQTKDDVTLFYGHHFRSIYLVLCVASLRRIQMTVGVTNHESEFLLQY